MSTCMKYKNGLVLGKFYPFHKGHQYLIESAIKQCEHVTVLVCSLSEEKIPGNLRYDWIRQIFSDSNVSIVHITDEVMQYPQGDEDEFFWDVWTGIIMREAKNMDVVFTSEDYGKELAKRIGFKYPDMHIDSVEVDKLRETYPVSGTAVRDNPLENWDFLPDSVKPYYMKKVVLVGPESTGKSVLSEKLAKHYGSSHVPEYGREYVEKYITGTRQIEFDDLERIAVGHIRFAKEIALENARNATNSKILILDTDLIITQIWSEIYFKKVPSTVMLLQNDYIQKGDLYFLLDIDIPWVDDGQREFPYLRRWHYNRIEKELKDRDLNYVKISGNFDERFESTVNYINRYMNAFYMNGESNYRFIEILPGEYSIKEIKKWVGL